MTRRFYAAANMHGRTSKLYRKIQYVFVVDVVGFFGEFIESGGIYDLVGAVAYFLEHILENAPGFKVTMNAAGFAYAGYRRGIAVYKAYYFTNRYTGRFDGKRYAAPFAAHGTDVTCSL